MYSSETKIRVRYSETDQMGYVYYGNYAQYYEVGRVEALRKLGLTYREMEERGTMLPVQFMDIKFIRPAHYDDELLLKTTVIELPKAKIHFEHECYNSDGVLLNIGHVQLVFVDKTSMKPSPAPEYFMEKMRVYF
jgi:acyl-CoA thioester hydrolase